MPALPAPSSLRPVAPSATSSSSLPLLVLHQLANRANDRIAPNERNTHTIIAIVIFLSVSFSSTSAAVAGCLATVAAQELTSVCTHRLRSVFGFVFWHLPIARCALTYPPSRVHPPVERGV